MFSRRVRLQLSGVAALHCVLLFAYAWLRYHHVHQRTFDLALYARNAWGLAHGDGWSPVLDAHVLAAHVAPVLVPLGLLGRVLGTVPVLLAAQALCIALSVFPLARIGARRLGTRGIWLSVVAWLLYPNLFHVGTYEFHPGTLAVLPMAWAFDALDSGRLGPLVWSALGVLACREDLGVFCLVIALVHYASWSDRRALALAAGCTAYTAIGVALTTAYAPATGSLDLHFGQWGGSPLGVVRTLLSDPAKVVAHFRAPERLSYLPRVLVPLSFFSLRAPRLLLPALPYLALNLLSSFPTAQQQYSHYLTPAVPALIAAGIVGVTAVRKRALSLLWLGTLGLAHHAFGGSPLSRDFDASAFRADAATEAARKVLAAIPPDASVQAPDPLLPHLAERHDVRRAAPPRIGSEYVVVDVSHRLRYARQEVLLRTTEEPLVRALFADGAYVPRVYAPPYALFSRGGTEPEAAEASGCLQHGGTAPAGALPRLTSCLQVEGARTAGLTLELRLVVAGACPADLALRIGPDPMPARVELLCDGALSPARLGAGDRLTLRYALREREAEALRARGLWVGALRASGDPPTPGDPAALRVELGP